MKAFIFPGQGSQSVGMGKELFRDFPDHVRRADEILGYSIETLCLQDPDRTLARTEFTQPALFVVNALSYLRRVARESPPDFLAGHSLGEYSALFAAGAFDFEDGLRIVKMRGQLMGEASGGGMAAVIGCDIGVIRQTLLAHGLSGVDIANLNSPRQTVLSGSLPDLEAARPHLERAGGGFIPLPVSAPFHSRYMAHARERFEAFLRGFRFRPLRIPVIANVSALPYQDHQVIRNLNEQLCGPVRWTESIGYLVSRGVDSFEEVGPGTVLTRLVRDIRQLPAT